MLGRMFRGLPHLRGPKGGVDRNEGRRYYDVCVSPCGLVVALSPLELGLGLLDLVELLGLEEQQEALLVVCDRLAELDRHVGEQDESGCHRQIVHNL